MKLSAEDAFRQFGDRVFSAAFSATGSKEDADDVVQDTFLKYWDTDQDFTDENHIKAWLLRVAINRSRDLLRSFWHRKKVPWEDYMEELSFEEPEDKSLFEAVMELPRKYRVTIHLHYYEDLSVSEIAEILHTTEGTVKSQLSRGRKLLKTKLMEAWDDDE
ncbi:sigma-70 family RNA polymerase sigma factor [Pseudoflavonifractor sp. MSJ-30]|uniref:RNA polymerase sigma factor n=1 Tax=Pseudoflavonifractor sp. MSJ-30 TaxID=2841525 RepID=UPI001C110D9A|nr:sigma-70 family RNA polymerase sigma factor [Pseudoflavonifractor sp. MSJ-30]MBU5452671.1 sigma-70 family RNA polymerase sigma factor [Pseudoflavonifractor sp. MSJ-30]